MEQSAQVNWPGRRIDRRLLESAPEEVARTLLGKVLARGAEDGVLAGRIVEVEAYLGPHCPTPDPAAHAYRGPTARNSVLFGQPGRAYLYSIYGRYYCMNVSCETEGLAGCVLLRALEPLLGLEKMAGNRGLKTETVAKPKRLASGPSRLCQALGLTRAEQNGIDLLDAASELQLRDDGFRAGDIRVTPRIGIQKAADWPLRFFLAAHECVSGSKRQNA